MEIRETKRRKQLGFVDSEQQCSAFCFECIFAVVGELSNEFNR